MRSTNHLDSSFRRNSLSTLALVNVAQKKHRTDWPLFWNPSIKYCSRAHPTRCTASSIQSKHQPTPFGHGGSHIIIQTAVIRMRLQRRRDVRRGTTWNVFSSRSEKTSANKAESCAWHSSLHGVIRLDLPQHSLRSSQHWVPTLNVVTRPATITNALHVIPRPSVVLYPRPHEALVEA